MTRSSIQMTALLFIAILMFSGCAGRGYMTPQWQPFRELSRVESLSELNSKAFPDSVTILFSWEYDELPQRDGIVLKEEVMGRIYPITDFKIETYGFTSGGNVTFLVDRSASMLENADRLDTLVQTLASVLPADSFTLMLFGRTVVSMGEFLPRDKFVDKVMNFSASPDANGSDMLLAVRKASEQLAQSPAASRKIVLITDNSFELRRGQEKLSYLRSILDRDSVEIVALSSAGGNHPWLRDLGPGRDGMYLQDVLRDRTESEIISFMRGNFRITYKPSYIEKDGLTHQVILDFAKFPVRRYASYTAPGIYQPTYAQEILAERRRQQAEAEQEIPEQARSIHPLLLMGIRIPFGEIGSDDLSRTAKALLDSVVTVLDSVPDEPEIVITGHTCDIGSLDFNMKLSVSRAEAVRKYLAANLKRSLTLNVKGDGPAKPIQPNVSEENRQLNRRAGIIFQLPEKTEPSDAASR